MAAMAREPPIYCRTRASFEKMCKGNRTMRRSVSSENELQVWKWVHNFYAMGGPFAIYTEWRETRFMLELIE